MSYSIDIKPANIASMAKFGFEESLINKAGDTAKNSREVAQLKDACEDFETVFLQQMLKEMRKTVDKTDLFGSSKHEEMFQEMIDQKICEKAAGSQPIGIAEMLYRELSANLVVKTENNGEGQ